MFLNYRKDLSDNNNPALEGIAFHEGACDSTYSALYSQDSGLSSGQTLAHELGHAYVITYYIT